MRPHFWLPALLAGCAIFPPDYEWKQVYPPALSYEWNVVAWNDLHKVCGINPAALPNLGACAIRLVGPRHCVIYSSYGEEQAKRVFGGDGESLWEHEVWNKDKSRGHCAGYDHQDIRRK